MVREFGRAAGAHAERDWERCSVFECLVLMAREGGLSGLYQGFLATWMRLGPWAFLFFVCFEQFRALALALTA